MDDLPRRPVHFPERNLDAPILNTNLVIYQDLVAKVQASLETYTLDQSIGLALPTGTTTFHLRQFKSVKEVISTVRKAFPSLRFPYTVLEPRMYPMFFREVYANKVEVEMLLVRAEEAVRPIWYAHATALAGLCGTTVEKIPDDIICDSFVSYASVEEVYLSHVESYISHRSTGGSDPYLSTKKHSTMVISKALCFLSYVNPKVTPVIMTYEQLLMLKDTAMVRKNGHLARSFVYPNDLSLERAMEMSFMWQEMCLSRYNNQGYELAKSCESLSKAYLSRIAGDPIMGVGDTYLNMVDKIKAKEVKIRKEQKLPPLRSGYLAEEFMSRVLSELKEPYQVVEIFGLQKFSGHPLIDPYLSGRAAAEKALDKDTTRPTDAEHHRAVFCRLFTETFVRKHHRWPRLLFTPRPTKLQELYNRQELILHRTSYPWTDWIGVKFGKEFDLETFPNYLELMDDKAISMYRDEKHLQWDQGTPRSHRRLLLELLERQGFDPVDCIARFDQDRVPEAWKICSLYPKEREFKLAARMFVMLPFEARAFFTIHEANIADKILPYFPQITMTEDKMKVHTRFLHFTAQRETDATFTLLIELDLTAWNLMWRALAVNGPGECLNQLFGVQNIFTAGHKFFQESIVMTRVAGCRPDGIETEFPPTSDLVHYNHIGGFEGILQKLWSINTVVFIERGLETSPYAYTITDQGDNIVLTLTCARDHTRPFREQATEVERDVLTRCSLAAASVHQILKPEECLTSTTCITYSKNVYVRGVDYPTTIKFLSRLQPSSAIDFPSYAAWIQAFFSGAYAASEGAIRPERCYWVALFQSALFMVRTFYQGGPYYRSLSAAVDLRTPIGIRLQLLTPSVLGGLPIIGPYEFFYRGGGDPTSKALASLKMLQAYMPEIRAIIARASDDGLYNLQPRIASLIQDPYGLPIKAPVTPEEEMASALLEIVKYATHNRDIAEVLSSTNDGYEEQLLEEMKKLTPFNPVIARDLYDCSILGSISTIKRMFLKTRTVQSYARQYSSEDLVGGMLKAGHRQITYIVQETRAKLNREDRILSVYDFVNQLRARWAPCGVKIEGISSYLPIDFPVTWDPLYTGPRIELEMRAGANHIFRTRGPAKPYLGTRTIEKRSEHGYKIIGKGMTASALKSLQRILSWSDHEPGLLQLIDSISVTRAGVKLSDYKGLLSGILGGSAGHRYSARIGERDASLVGIASPASWATFTSDHAGYLSATTDDYPIMWQEFFLYLLRLTCYRWDHTGGPGYLRVCCIIGDSILERLSATRFSIPSHNPLPDISINSALVCDQDIRIVQTSGPNHDSKFTLEETDSRNSAFPALVDEIYQSCRRANTVRGVLSDMPARVKISVGLPELIGMGLSTYVDAASVALLDISLATVRSMSLGTAIGRNINLVHLKFGELLVEAVAQYLLHPLMASDPLIQKLNIGTGPKYTTGVSSTGSLPAVISSRAIRMLNDPSSKFYSTPIVVFGSSEEGSTLDAHIRLLRRDTMREVASLRITPIDGDFIVGSTVARLVRHNLRTETGKLNFFQDLLYTYRSHKRGKDLVDEGAAEAAERVAKGLSGHRVLYTSDSAQEIVRSYRSYPRPNQVLPPIVYDPEPRVWKPSFQVVVRETGSMYPSALIKALFNYRRSRGRPFSLTSSSYRAWVTFSHIFKDRVIMVVGSGIGACAAAALVGGARSVYGHDLSSDFPASVSLQNYVPPLVRLYRCPPRYAQSLETFSTSGDWFDSQVSLSLLSHCPPDGLLVLDITSDKGNSWEVLQPLLMHEWLGLCLLRIQGMRRMQAEVVGKIRAVGRVTMVVLVDEDEDFQEIVYLFLKTRVAESLPVVPMEVCDPLSPSIRNEVKTVELIVASLVAPLGCGLKGTVRETLVSVLMSFKSYLAWGTVGPSYSGWTEILAACASCEFILLYTESERLALIDHALTGGTVPLVMLDNHLIAFSDKLRYLYTKLAPRLLGYEDYVLDPL